MSRKRADSNRGEIRAIARAQKGVLLCLVAYLAALLGNAVIPRPLLIAFLVVLGIVSTVFVFQLATKLYGQQLGIVLAILTLVPLVGFFVLLLINVKATSTLKAKGIEVGLLGASGDALR